MENNHEIKIAHLYPELLNLYGDRGNIMSLVKRLNWREINAKVIEYQLNDDIDFSDIDIVFLGGGSDREQLLVCERLKFIKSDFEDYVNNNGCVLAVCGGYQLLGHYYKLKNETITGLSILDIYTEMGKKRLIGNIVLKPTIQDIKENIVGFENHGGRTYINDHKPLGTVLLGYGNNDKDEIKNEGVVYKNVVGTYLHGPILPKNPYLTDYILLNALKRKYNDNYQLTTLNDKLEHRANKNLQNRYRLCK